MKEIIRTANVTGGELEVVPQQQAVMWRATGAVCASQLMHVKREDDSLNFDFARLWKLVGPAGAFENEVAMNEALTKALTEFKPGSRG